MFYFCVQETLLSVKVARKSVREEMVLDDSCRAQRRCWIYARTSLTKRVRKSLCCDTSGDVTDVLDTPKGRSNAQYTEPDHPLPSHWWSVVPASGPTPVKASATWHRSRGSRPCLLRPRGAAQRSRPSPEVAGPPPSPPPLPEVPCGRGRGQPRTRKCRTRGGSAAATLERSTEVALGGVEVPASPGESRGAVPRPGSRGSPPGAPAAGHLPCPPAVGPGGGAGTPAGARPRFPPPASLRPGRGAGTPWTFSPVLGEVRSREEGGRSRLARPRQSA